MCFATKGNPTFSRNNTVISITDPHKKKKIQISIDFYYKIKCDHLVL